MTELDFADLVLTRLNVIGAGESGSAEDNALVQQAYEFYYAELLEKAAATWPMAAIPDRVAEPLAQCMKIRMFSQFYSTATLDQDSWKRAERALFDMIGVKRTQAPIQAEYF